MGQHTRLSPEVTPNRGQKYEKFFN